MFYILNPVNDVFFDLVSGLFGTVARVYDIIIRIAENEVTKTSIGIADFATTLYVLAGVFMLFRVILSMIQMVINPDLVSDKQAGAGKIVIRVVMAIVMLIAFAPNGILFRSDDPKTADSDGGLFSRVENAILADDGLIKNILVNEGSIGGNPFNFTGADGTVSKSCYYYSYEDNTSKVHKVTFYKGKPNKDNALEVESSNGVYYVVNSGVVGGADSGREATYSPLNGKIKNDNGLVSNKGSLKCPKSLNKKNGKYYTSDIVLTDSTVFGGWTSVDQMINGVKEISKAKDSSWLSRFLGGALGGVLKGINNMPGGIGGVTSFLAKLGVENVLENNNDFPLLMNLENRGASLGFSQGIAMSMQECAEGYEKECDDAQSRMFGSTGGNNDIVKLADQGVIKIDYFLSIVLGVALIAYLVFLCVDVVIRKFKLLLLELLAPIPIVSYVNPKDEIFNRWLKMYISTYLDIFIKLFAINIALVLLNSNKIPEYDNLFITIIYIIAILLFAKLIPSMISKIFGLDNMGGSFKEIGGMLKAGAGLAAGAAIGGAVGAATGQGLGRATGALKGALMGAGSGSKGKIMGGAQGIAAKNAKINKQKEDGLDFMDRMAIAGYNAAGIVPKGDKMQRQLDAVRDMNAKNKALKDFSEEEAVKKNQMVKDFKWKDAAGVEHTNNRDVFVGDEAAKLEALQARDTSAMTEDQLIAHSRAIAEQKAFLAAAKTAGGARRIREQYDNDSEFRIKVDDLNDSIDTAKGLGIDIVEPVNPYTITDKTIKSIKETTNDEANRIQKDPEMQKQIARNKYLQNK